MKGAGTWLASKSSTGERSGRRILRAVLERAIERIRREPGCTEIMIVLQPDNTIARALYRSLGFVESGQRIGGEDVLCLFLDVGSKA